MRLVKLELHQKPLLYLYNLLVADLQLKKEATPEELETLLAEVNEAMEALTSDTVWLACPKEDCDPRPFRLTAETLADAEGVVECEYCGTLCLRVEK